jgi:poly(3-hydroxybutyrate) depolymerase
MRGCNGLDNIDANGSPNVWKECNKCRAKWTDSQAKTNAARRASNEKAKSQSLEFYTWEETLHMIDAGFAPIIAEF